jgi:hypothetical protein
LDAIGVSLANKVSKTFEISAKHAAKAVWDGYKKIRAEPQVSALKES